MSVFPDINIYAILADIRKYITEECNKPYTSSNIPKHICNQSHTIKPSYYTKQKRSLNRNILKPHNKRENYE